jgi:hypothetical protein
MGYDTVVTANSAVCPFRIHPILNVIVSGNVTKPCVLEHEALKYMYQDALRYKDASKAAKEMDRLRKFLYKNQAWEIKYQHLDFT